MIKLLLFEIYFKLECVFFIHKYLLLVNFIAITYQNLINNTDLNLIDILGILYLLTMLTLIVLNLLWR